MQGISPLFLIPPRIPFEPLEPAGLSTGRVEHLSSYLTRIASNASVPVGAIIQKMIKPIFNKGNLYADPHYANQAAFYLANGRGIVAKYWAEVLESITGRTDLLRLTLFNWQIIFPDMTALTSHFKRWCPHCFQEAADNNRVIYEQLVWSISTVELCSEHLIPLEDRCLNCGENQFPVIGSRHLVGFCPKCNSWLGRAASNVEVRHFDSTFAYKRWVAQSIARLFDHEGTHQKHIKRESFASMIQEGIRFHFDGNASAFGRHLHRSKSDISGWRHGKILPRFQTVAEISYAFQMPIESLFAGDYSAWNYSVLQTLPYSVRQGLPKRKKQERRNWEQYGAFLEKIVSGEIGWISSFQQAADYLKIEGSCLRRHFPNLSIKISKICRTRRKARSTHNQNEKHKKWFELAWEAALLIRSQGEKVTRRKILVLLEKSGIRDTRTVYPIIQRVQRTLAGMPS